MAFPGTFDCGIVLPQQDRAEDCWADCAAGVLAWLKINPAPSQDDVRERFLGPRDLPATWEGITEVFATYDVACNGPGQPLAEIDLRSVVEKGPVLAGYQWWGGGGHVAIIVGRREWTGRYLVQDPMMGPGELSYAEILMGYGKGRCVAMWFGFAKKEKP